MIDVLSIASEAYPLIKTGGLADVVGALPAALAPGGVAMRVLLPGYPAVMAAIGGEREVYARTDFFGGRGRLVAGQAGGLDVIALDAPHLFDRPGNPYSQAGGADWPDNWQRFAALSFAGYELGRGVVEGYQPQILHCHDWQTALVPAYAAYNAPIAAKTILTVHNIAFQGRFSWDIFPQLRLDYRAADEGAVEYFGGVGFLKAGLQCADVITTVSPTYAREMCTPSYGMGLDGLLRTRSDRIHGILNGIDAEAWDPTRDPALAQAFSVASIPQRQINKDTMCARFGIEPGAGPVFAVVSRLTWQKGLDMLVSLIDGLVEQGGSLVVLGSGEPGLEVAFLAARERHKGRVGVEIGYDEGLSHLVQAGADVMLVPSRFEPCGLTQLYGLRYGCVPLVSRVGGLADTVIDANEAAVDAGVATGIVFAPATEEAMAEGIRRAIQLYGRPKVWHKMQRRGMSSDVSWQASAKKYTNLYADLLGHKRDVDQDD